MLKHISSLLQRLLVCVVVTLLTWLDVRAETQKKGEESEIN